MAKETSKPPNAQAFANAEPKHRRGVKINNDTSTVPKPPPDTSAAFQERANKVHGKFAEYRDRGWELAAHFKGLVEDTILPVNKTIIAKDIEQETINKLIILATEMNEDNDQQQGIGSVVLSTLLMKMVLLQRDKINTLLYRIDNVEKHIDNKNK
jgi:hypothetical protein